MSKWDETALVLLMVGVAVTCLGHFEGVVVIAGALIMASTGDPA